MTNSLLFNKDSIANGTVRYNVLLQKITLAPPIKVLQHVSAGQY